MRHRAMALLASLLLVSQVSTQPVAAADHRAERSIVFADPELVPGSPQTPIDLNSSNSFTALTADVKVELVSGWWVGKERHSKFKISNVGNATAPDVWYDFISYYKEPKAKTDPGMHGGGIGEFGDMPAGTSHVVVVVCDPLPVYICTENRLIAHTDGSDSNPANNRAKDDV